MKKVPLKVIEFCKKMKQLADQLSVDGFLISEKELVMCILTRLGPKYETVVVNYTNKYALPTLQEVRSYLIHYETRIEQFNTFAVFPIVHMVTTNTSNNNSGSSHSGHVESVNISHNQGRYENSNQNSFDDSRNRFNGRGNFGHGRGRNGRNFRPRCQICNRIGHTTNVCYYNSGNFIFQTSNSQGNF